MRATETIRIKRSAGPVVSSARMRNVIRFSRQCFEAIRNKSVSFSTWNEETKERRELDWDRVIDHRRLVERNEICFRMHGERDPEEDIRHLPDPISR